MRFRSKGSYRDPAIGRVPVSERQLSRFVAALDLLDVWNWKRHYQPEDAGYMVDDGGSWSFKALIGGRSCATHGTNAYPAFEDASQTAIDAERLGLLLAAMQDILGITLPTSRSDLDRFAPPEPG